MNERLLTARAVAELLSFNPRVVRTWVGRVDGPAPVRLGQELRWRESEIRAWLESLPRAVSPSSSGRRTETR
jgi:predicted DNA-binding transcriptional regulator AlpA